MSVKRYSVRVILGQYGNPIAELYRDSKGPVVDWDCYEALEQRLERLRPYIKEVWEWHRYPGDDAYNECDKAECMWCEMTRKILEDSGLGARPGPE